MSEPAPSCSCRLPWIVVVIALGVLLGERLIVPSTVPSSPLNASATANAPTQAPDPRLATLQHDLSETRRVLDDVQSALAQRDREIATANDDLRMARQELEVLRAKHATPTSPTP